MLNEADTVGVLPGREPRADGVAADATPRRSSTTSSSRSRSSGRARSWAAWCIPFFDRRQGRAPVEYPASRASSRSSKRTLGVPLFQEQLLRIAMVAAGFTRRRGGGAAARDGVQALDGARWQRSRRGCARGWTERGIGPAGAGPDREVHHVVRAVRLPRVARGELRAHRVRELLSQGAPPGRVLRRRS